MSIISRRTFLGTGAVAAMPMLDMALELYNNMLTFSDIGM